MYKHRYTYKTTAIIDTTKLEIDSLDSTLPILLLAENQRTKQFTVTSVIPERGRTATVTVPNRR